LKTSSSKPETKTTKKELESQNSSSFLFAPVKLQQWLSRVEFTHYFTVIKMHRAIFPVSYHTRRIDAERRINGGSNIVRVIRSGFRMTGVLIRLPDDLTSSNTSANEDTTIA
jgi:hypothetical protein